MLESILGDILRDMSAITASLEESDALAEKIALAKRALSQLKEENKHNSSSKKVGASPPSSPGGVGTTRLLAPTPPGSPSTTAVGSDRVRGVLESLGLVPPAGGVASLNSIAAAVAATRSAPGLSPSPSTSSLLAQQKEKTSAYRGITRRKKRWEAHVWRHGKQAYLGGYRDEEEAARAYDLAVLKIRGREAETNFPPENYLQDLRDMGAEGMTAEEFIRELRERAKQRGKQVREEEEDKRIEALRRITSSLHQSHQHASNPVGLGARRTETALWSGSVGLSKLIEDEKLALLIQHLRCQGQQSNQQEQEALLQLLVASQTAPNSAKSEGSTF